MPACGAGPRTGDASSPPDASIDRDDEADAVPADGRDSRDGAPDDAPADVVLPPVPPARCYRETERPPSSAPFGFPMPNLDDERRTYRAWGLTWSMDAEPSVPADPDFEVRDPDIHGDTEGDDLWTSLAMALRTGQPGYWDRARAWRRYFLHDYRSCVGTSGATFCYDRDSFGGCHFWGAGLIAWSRAMGDMEALAEAERLGEELERLWSDASPYGCLPRGGCTWYGVRAIGRHLLFATRLAEVTGQARWVALRDRILDRLLVRSPDWDEALGTYVLGDWSTNTLLSDTYDREDDYYARGARIVSAFELGVLSEGMDHAYRVTGNEELRRRMIRMAQFVATHGLDPEYQYTGSRFGVVDGRTWHNYSAREPVTFWDPVYTTSLVNLLVRGYLYSCDETFLRRARLHFERGNGGLYGEPRRRAVAEGIVHHFVDSRFDSSHGNFYYAYNKGELQYTYLLFSLAPP